MTAVLKRQVASGDYEVDPRAVVEAIFTSRRGHSLRALCSQMLIAAEVRRRSGGASQCDALAGDDPTHF